MDIQQIIAENLKKLRTERNLSLGQLSLLCGVSKVMLSQIERGETNPTVNTLWKIAGGLKVPYTALLEQRKRITSVVRRPEAVSQADDSGAYRLFCCFPHTPRRNFELFGIELDAGHRHTTSGHSDKSEEYILVQEGELTLLLKDGPLVLRPGDAAGFSADAEHSYLSTGAETLRAVVVNFYPA